LVRSNGGFRLKKTYFSAALALAALAGAVAFVVHRWRTSGFDWSQFASALRHVDWNWLLPAIFLILTTYVGRALRWEIMLRPLRKDVKLWRIFSATAIGFTAVVLFGRAGEPVRPYLIAKQENVSFSSQIAVWIVERILDLLMVLLIFGVALTRISSSAIQPGPRMQVILEAGGYTVGLIGAASLALLIALRQFRGDVLHRLIERLAFLPEKPLRRLESVLMSFEEGMQSIRRAHLTALLLAYSVLEWLVIAAAFDCVCHAFPATANLTLTDAVILLGFVAFGSIVQIPGVGGGMQIATVIVLTEFFGVPFEAASGIAVVLWSITFVIIVPLGLVLAFHEGIKWRNLRHLEPEVSSAAAPAEPTPAEEKST
jgi:glycosyltransferase 2 family protein